MNLSELNQTNVLLYVLIIMVLIFIIFLSFPRDDGYGFKVKSEEDAMIVEKDLSLSLNEVKRDLQELESIV